MTTVSDADRAKAAEMTGPDEGCTCGQTTLIAEHTPTCALELCHRCRMVGPDHLPGDDRCWPCQRPHADAAALAEARAPYDRLTADLRALAEEWDEMGDEVRLDWAAARLRAVVAATEGSR